MEWCCRYADRCRVGVDREASRIYRSHPVGVGSARHNRGVSVADAAGTRPGRNRCQDGECPTIHRAFDLEAGFIAGIVRPGQQVLRTSLEDRSQVGGCRRCQGGGACPSQPYW